MNKKALLALIFIVIFSGCGGRYSQSPYQSEFFAMDTVMTFTIYGDNAQEAARAAEAELRRIERFSSAHLTSSEIARLNESGQLQLSEEAVSLLETAIELSEETGGAFDISVYPLMREWGFSSDEPHCPSRERITELLALTGSEKISIDGSTVTLGEGMGLDLGAIAKGYASDALAEVLLENGIGSAIISLGGNVYALGSKPNGTPWKVAITDPFDPSGMIGTIEVESAAVVTSGGYQRYFEENGKRWHHILNPETGYPAESALASATIVCPSGTLADGLSTAVFVMGRDKAAELWRRDVYDFEMILISTEGEISVTEGLKDSFSAADFKVIER